MFPDFSLLTDISFHLSYFMPVSKTEIKPKPFDCKDGTVLYERFFYVVRGTIIFNKGKQNEFVAKEGTVFYLPYNITYHSEWEVEESMEFISLNFILKDSENKILSFSDHICMLQNDISGNYFLRFKELSDTWTKAEIGYKVKCQSLFFEILYHFIAETTRSSLKSRYHEVAKGILYLENNFISDISTEELAGMCNVSLSTFRRAFHEYKGMSPVKYRNLLRMQRAAALLASGEYTVAEASEAVNCPDVYYFSKLFKKTLGKAPSKYKTIL